MALYHYTTETRLAHILATGRLQTSSDRQADSTYGIGWYFTDLHPGTCEKVLMRYCWERDTLYQRVRCFLQVQVLGGVPRLMRAHVYFVPQAPFVSFTPVNHGPIPECPLKPCHSCASNPERRPH